MTRTFLENRHPDYLRRAADWRFWSQSYEGGDAYRRAGHLFRFPRETQANYDERLKRASRVNFTRQVVDLLVQYLRKESPSRDVNRASEPLQRFWQDTDRQGRTMDDFMGAVATTSALFGCAYMVVDKPALLASNRLEQDAARLNCYAYCVSPLDVLDWVPAESGEGFRQILLRETVREAVDLSQSRDGDGLQERYRLWTLTDEGVVWQVFVHAPDGQPVCLDQGLLPLREIPVVRVCRTGNGTGATTGYSGGCSVAEEVATLDRKVFNYESLLDQILYEQTFSTLLLPWNGRMEEFYEQWELTLGTKSILPYDAASAVAPKFISPDASQGDLLLRSIEQSITTIYRSKNLLDTLGTAQPSVTPASGIARGYDFEKVNAGLSAFADDLEKAERRIAQLVNAWEGDFSPVAIDLIDYPDTFDVKTLLQSLQEAEALARAVPSRTFQSYLQKSIVRQAAPKLPADEARKVEAELGNANAILDTENIMDSDY